MMQIDRHDFGLLMADATKEGRETIMLFKDKDGNWRGTTNKYGTPVFVRDIGPEVCLQLLLTHDGKNHS